MGCSLVLVGFSAGLLGDILEWLIIWILRYRQADDTGFVVVKAMNARLSFAAADVR
jgi:hypothetical protein